MKNTTRFMGLVALLCAYVLLSGCATISVNYDYDDAADFTIFKTYSWKEMDGKDMAGGEPGANNGLLTTRVQSSVDAQMAARGLKKTDDNGDLNLVYHFGATDKIQVTDWGYNYSGYYRHGGYGYGGRSVDVYQYTEGTLVIDIVDAGKNSLVWRGSGTGVVDVGQKTPEEIQAKIDKAVAEIMANFPPAK
jgi:hypothetical protein